ncbi:MAG: hypothetical protein HOV71_21600 [Hamadaea sp.]|nr:hypothetical protein [Hamadaea sp.]NUR50732.1 hypothetical protein [Hamadaea sp.]NUT03748.1 hypothetical protein [Hamadaea sp.]
MDDIRVLRLAWWYRSVLWGCRLSVLGAPVMVLGVVSRAFLVIGALILTVPWVWFGAVRWYVIVEYDVSYGQFIDRLMDDMTNLRYW